ncbi:MAG: IMP cyclohydrolase [Candidatus Falkowbacteria bacterium]
MNLKLQPKDEAKENLLALKANSYPGRGIIVGLDESGQYLIQVYWIMGRSENSRNRIFVQGSGGVLKTAPADPGKVKDPSLIIYTAMSETLTKYAVSNGHQTIPALATNGMEDLMETWQYEPDAPNYTPRITALFDFDKKVNGGMMAKMLILKKSPFSEDCDSYLYDLAVNSPGLGYCMTTYDGDGDPLPSFSGDPYLLPLEGDIDTVAQNIWKSLHGENRISLAVKFINLNIGESELRTINKYEAVK